MAVRYALVDMERECVVSDLLADHSEAMSLRESNPEFSDTLIGRMSVW